MGVSHNRRYEIMKMTKLKVLILSACIATSAACVPAYSQAAPAAQESVIHVVGYAQEQVAPDTATVSAGIQTTAESASDARTQNNTIMQRINTSMRKLGIEPADMQTTSFNLQPNYDQKGRKIVSYTVSNTMRIKVTDFNLLSSVVNEAGNAGANEIYGISFSNEHSDVIKDKLISQAVANGRKAAQAAAAAAGSSLGRVKQININNTSPIYRENFAALSMRAAKAEDSTPIEPGTNTMTESVDMTYYLN